MSGRNDNGELDTSFYDDVGECYEFCLLEDDVWKKDEIFINFAVKLVRLIALEVGCPVQYIGYGKWGARLTWDDEERSVLTDWVKKIENHPTYVQFKEVCKFATYHNSSNKEQEEICDYLNNIPVLKMALSRAYIKASAKEHLSSDAYGKFLRGIR